MLKGGYQIIDLQNKNHELDVGRNWVSHGKLKAVDYIKEEPKKKNAEVFVVFPSTAKVSEISATKAELSSLGYSARVLTERR